ncbi:hypothetical protein J4Q44_G00320810 [Coregonus suidteri]|uniref:Uncharacterized protein n=1 Tax=Coregonus suidteri TaxID=861788 RepID=A0AAN8QI02_9TELE
MLKRVPKKTLKSLMKKKAHIRVGTAADAKVELNVLLFLHMLAEEAERGRKLLRRNLRLSKHTTSK